MTKYNKSVITYQNHFHGLLIRRSFKLALYFLCLRRHPAKFNIILTIWMRLVFKSWILSGNQSYFLYKQWKLIKTMLNHDTKSTGNWNKQKVVVTFNAIYKYFFTNWVCEMYTNFYSSNRMLAIDLIFHIYIVWRTTG